MGFCNSDSRRKRKRSQRQSQTKNPTQLSRIFCLDIHQRIFTFVVYFKKKIDTYGKKNHKTYR